MGQVDLDAPLESHPELVRGTLENGLEYVILPNKSPSGRFEAHLQVISVFCLVLFIFSVYGSRSVVELRCCSSKVLQTCF